MHNYVKINIEPASGQFFITAENEDGFLLRLFFWKNLFFSRHQESFYGTFAGEKNDGVLIDGWDLASLLATEGFNRFIRWDWDETAQICLAAATPIYEAITAGEWLPDFAALEDGEFRWRLPERIISEFAPAFWEQTVAGVTVREFVNNWFNNSLNGFLQKNEQWRERLGNRLEALKNSAVSPRTLAAYFDEQSWSEWLGLREAPAPFTIGLRLEEPAEIHGTWDLGIFLRGKKQPNLLVDLYDDSNMPDRWKHHLDIVDKEVARWVRLFPWLKGEKGISRHLTEEEAWLFLTEASEVLLALGVEILLPSWWQAMKNARFKVKAKLKGTPQHGPTFVGLNALLDYNWRFAMNGVELSEEEFNRLVEEKRRLVFINGRWIKLDPEFVQQIQVFMKKAEKEGLHIRDVIEQEMLRADEEAAEWEADADEDAEEQELLRVQFELNRHWQQFITQLRDLKAIPSAPVPAGFRGELRPYQKQGMDWLLFLRQYGFGALLADDMGLGKTIQLIAYLLAVKERENGEFERDGLEETAISRVRTAAPNDGSGPALIICPTSVLGNWQKEIDRFAPGLKVYLHYGPNRLKEKAFSERALASDVVLTSYGLAHLDFSELSSLTWGTIAIDEAQNIKNSATKQSRAVRKLRGRHHIAMTGTPMENRLSELWTIFDFTNRGFLGSLGQFQKRFIAPIEKDEDKNKIKELQALIRPFLLRRSKMDEEVSLNLPDKLEQKEYCPLTAEQASLYEQLVSDTLARVEHLSGMERRGLVLQLLGRLKQLCNHPALYLKEEKPQRVLERSVKLEKLVEIIEAVLEQEESCLIFTQYIEMGEIIRSVLHKKFGIEVPFLNGSVGKSQRDAMIARFQEREFPVFLLSLKAGGTGLNLTAANHVVHYDRWWNPAVENQATDRAYRIGQKRFVHVHKFISTGTLEEKIDAMIEKKQSLNDAIIQSDNWITELSTDELRELVKLG